MGTMASQITSVSIVYSIVCSGTDQRKHQSSASLAFVKGIHRGPVISPHKSPVMQKMIPFDDVIMCLCVSLCASIMSFYTPVWKTGRIMPWQCPSVRLSVCPSVRPSVHVFRTFLQHALRYQFETWYIHSIGGTTCRVWVASQLGHFDLVYSQK